MPDTVMTTEPASSPIIVQGPRQRSAQWGELMSALAKAQGEIEGAKKDSSVVIPGQNQRKYADLASVWAAIREPLAKNGLAITQWPRVTENAVEIETILAHGEQFISDVLWMPCGKMDAHGIGSAITYGRRYALMAAAGVAPEDDDGGAAMERSGVPGSAGGGQDFRPPGPRRFQSAPETPATHRNGVRQASANGARMAVDEPESVARAGDRMKGTMINTPAAAANAVEQMAWIKDARKLIGDATTKATLSDWWRQNEEQRETAAAAIPVEFDKLIVLFDEKMTAVAQAGA